MADRVPRVMAGLLCAGLLAACGDTAPATEEFAGTRLDPAFEVVATPLVDVDGAEYSLVDDTDKPMTLVFFGYTNCPDICGQVMATLAGTMTRLDEADREAVEVVFVTTDPERDTAEVVDSYASRFDPSFLGLTGDLADIVEVGLSLGIGVEQGEKLPSGDYEVTHGTQVLAIDSTDQAPVFWRHDVSQAELTHDLQLLLDEGR